jgi:predicted house-cleaning noncanonical NTP pyrophosphatase (MazG superfamily)
MITRYDKLVRDKIPDIIRQDNQIPVTHQACPEEYLQKLLDKLVEESEEFRESTNPDELADLLEVIEAIKTLKSWSTEEIEARRIDKLSERGGFSRGIILEEIRAK